MSGAGQAYPLVFDVEYPERLSRLLIFVKWLLALPHWIILYGLGVLVGAITFVAWFAILFTGRYPRELFDLVVKSWRWQANVAAYVGLMRDEYPPFSWEEGRYPVRFQVEYPERLSRLLIFVKWLLALPHYIVLFLLGLVAYLAWIVAWWAILITGRFPRALFDFLVGLGRWNWRVQAYTNLLRDEYPPFSLR
ncbi:MAG: DUF4389 domain-containing protein [Dehalococcoidia bacterium]|jgi:hypothetical protein|nr:DUF4389 domain-containing protein [Dehalococcoidia bacterium]